MCVNNNNTGFLRSVVWHLLNYYWHGNGDQAVACPPVAAPHGSKIWDMGAAKVAAARTHAEN